MSEAAARSRAQAPIPFFGTARENTSVQDGLIDALQRLCGTDTLLNGPAVKTFEAVVAEAAGRAYAVAVNSATDALGIALRAAGIGEGDEVLVPAFSFVATATPVLHAGARPVFVDVTPPDAPDGSPLTMDLRRAERALTPRTKALIWTWLYGGMAAPGPVELFARQHGLVLIEDASQAFGARWSLHRAGATGDVSVFSFDRTKTLGALGTGGALVTDDPAVHRAAQSLRYHGVGPGGFERVGRNSQMSEWTADALTLKAARHKAWSERRRAIAHAFDAAVVGTRAIRPQWADGCRHTFHKYVLFLDERDALADALAAEGIPTRIHYPRPIPAEPVFGSAPAGAFPVADRAASRAISLPMHAFLSDAEVARIARVVRTHLA